MKVQGKMKGSMSLSGLWFSVVLRRAPRKGFEDAAASRVFKSGREGAKRGLIDGYEEFARIAGTKGADKRRRACF